MGKKKKKNKPILPVEILREIFLKLPVRSLLRFKCVCKSWLSLISNPQFCISHYDLAASPSYRLLLKSSDFYAQSIDTEAPFIEQRSGDDDAGDHYLRLRAVNLFLPPPSPPLSPPPHRNSAHFLDNDDSNDDDDFNGGDDDFRNQPEIWGSCRGFVLLFFRKGDRLMRRWDLVLWNPSIGVHKRLPEFEYDTKTKEFIYGFGYDPSKDDFFIIIISFQTGIHMFSLKTNSWSRLDVNVSCLNPAYPFRAGLFLNGALHWLLFPEDERFPVIIAFDLIKRRIFQIPLLDRSTLEEYIMTGFRIMGECLSVCCCPEQVYEVTEIWVMKEYKVQSSWTKLFVIPAEDFSPICITRDGTIFGAIDGKFEKRNSKGKRLEHLNYGEDYELYYCGNIQSAMYRESLLLLPAVIRKTMEDEQGETSEDDQQ